MESSSRQAYARHSTVPVEGVAEFVKTANPVDPTWIPTIVNPSEMGGVMQKSLFWVHILVWVISLVLSSITNFGVTGLQAKSNTSCTGAANETANCFAMDPTSSTTAIGVIGGISTIVGVVALLAGAALYDAKTFRTQVWLNVAIQSLTLLGSFSTFFVWAKSSAKNETGAFWLGLFACLFQLYAQVLLYCTSATLDVMALPRAFIPCAAFSVQLISAIAIQGGDWHHESGEHFTNGKKLAAWLIPVLMGVSIVTMVFLRRLTRNVVTQVSDLGEYPFVRSLVLAPFLLSGILAVFKLSFVKSDPDPVGFMFATLGMLFNFAIITVVFVPSGVSSAALTGTQMDYARA